MFQSESSASSQLWLTGVYRMEHHDTWLTAVFWSLMSPVYSICTTVAIKCIQSGVLSWWSIGLLEALHYHTVMAALGWHSKLQVVYIWGADPVRFPQKLAQL